MTDMDFDGDWDADDAFDLDDDDDFGADDDLDLDDDDDDDFDADEAFDFDDVDAEYGFDIDGDGDWDADDEWAAADYLASESDEGLRRLVRMGYVHGGAAEEFIATRHGRRVSAPSYQFSSQPDPVRDLGWRLVGWLFLIILVIAVLGTCNALLGGLISQH